MKDKEVLLEVKSNLEKQAECYERVLERTKLDQRHNELLLTLVNNELRAMEEVEREKFVPWREQVAVGDKAWNEKQRKDKLNESVKAMMIEDGLTDYMLRDKEYTFEEFEEKVLDRYTEVSEKVKATEKCESGTSKQYLIMNELKRDLDNTVTVEDKKVWMKNKGYDAVTAKIKEGKALDQSEVNSLFKPCYEIECAIVDILKKHKTLKLKDIVYFVEQKELDFESKHIYGFVQSVLNRSEKFKKVSYGNWSLRKDDGEKGATKPDSADEADSIAESTVLSVVRPKWNGVISYVDKLGVVNKIQQK